MKIKFLKPNINNTDIKNMVKAVKSGWLVPGPYVEKLERCFGDFIGKPAVMVSSGTAALHISLLLLGIKKGDEVITTPLSWVSTSNVILYCGATPVFADVDENGLLDIEEVKKKITPKTKAIIVVHLYGQMVDMQEFEKLSIPIIEDSAHALESQRNVYPGQLGFTACFSFHAAKNITAGGGGMIVTGQPERAKLLRRHGVKNEDGKRVMVELGYKYEPADYQAALLLDQLRRIEKSHKKRQEVFKRYEEAFKGKIKFPTYEGTHACHMFVILVENRDETRKLLLEKGIETSIHYSPIHLEPYYQKLGFKKGSFPIAEKLGEQIITLPTYDLTRKEQKYIISEVLHACHIDPAG